MVALSKFLSAAATATATLVASSSLGLGLLVTGVAAQTTEQNIERNYGDSGGVYIVSKESMTDLMQSSSPSPTTSDRPFGAPSALENLGHQVIEQHWLELTSTLSNLYLFFCKNSLWILLLSEKQCFTICLLKVLRARSFTFDQQFISKVGARS